MKRLSAIFLSIFLLILFSSSCSEEQGIVAPSYNGANVLMAYGRCESHFYFCTVCPKKINQLKEIDEESRISLSDAVVITDEIIVEFNQFRDYKHVTTVAIPIEGDSVYGVYYSSSPKGIPFVVFYVYVDGSVELPIKC